ncbi:c-type cytochrome [Aquisalimonas asiatica]|uniref:Cytochrome c5 n=1 Tax=Aquisalimonas asiatica TaxID=406100 RepID=A0A1H8V846_9GAMM|nr:Cytochrome c5 [Aquisalimonas asiatica]
MSDEQDDKAFLKTFGGVMALLVVSAVIIGILAVFASTFDESREQARLAHERDRVERNLLTVGVVREAGESAPDVAVDDAEDDDDDEEEVAMSGSEVNETACMACHDSGAMNAPVTGDEDAWASLYEEKGLEELVDNAINGIGAMPARGGDSSLSDEEVRNAVVYMLGESGVDVDD